MNKDELAQSESKWLMKKENLLNEMTEIQSVFKSILKSDYETFDQKHGDGPVYRAAARGALQNILFTFQKAETDIRLGDRYKEIIEDLEALVSEIQGDYYETNSFSLYGAIKQSSLYLDEIRSMVEG